MSRYLIYSLLFLCLGGGFQSAQACGGFFCQIVPIDQAGEQIIFRKDGNMITTMVQIQYAGPAEEFGWVLPVPATPELSIGSDTVIRELELSTRPQFQLETRGSSCIVPFENTPTGRNNVDTEDGGTDSVVVEQTLAVGPFDAQIISGSDASGVADWLAANNLDLTDRGTELLTPYVDAGMKFVVLKLQSTKEVGDIQPIILKYESNQPMIPLRLTALASEENMGINVWLLGEARAVPDNYLDIVPNYTKLNWFAGTFNGYASYQNLVTEAMDEAGGQGFVTDYAGSLDILDDQLTPVSFYNDIIASLANSSDAEYIADMFNRFNNIPSVNSSITASLPLTADDSADLYSSAVSIEEAFSAEEIRHARDELELIFQQSVVDTTENSLDIFEGDLYLTRLYTTISPDEMTVDPTFVFNPDLSGQPLVREATLDLRCNSESITEWTLTLGPGTGRDGEVVIDAVGNVPFAPPVLEQDSSFTVSKSFSQGASEVITQNNYKIAVVKDSAQVGETDSISRSSSSGGGGSLSWFVLLLIAGIVFLRVNRVGLNAK